MRARGLRVGAFAVSLSLLAGACGVLPGGGGSIHVTAYFTKTISLYEGSQVRVLGLPAGHVTSVDVAGTKVKVGLDIDKSVPVPADAKATIVPFSLIGERYVQLFPAYTGGARLESGAVIPLARTSIPVEPDEALRSLRDLLDRLNPQGTHALTKNLAADLKGQGRRLNDTIRDFSALTRDFGEKSKTIGKIIDSLDQITSTLITREGEIGSVLDEFASVSDVLAEERTHLANVIDNLTSFTRDAKDLVSAHASDLDHDLNTLEHVAMSLQANIDAVGQLLDAAPLTASGLKGAYNPSTRVVTLRDNAGLLEGTGNSAPAQVQSGPTSPTTSPPQTSTTQPPPPPAPVPQTPFQPLDDLLQRLVDQGGTPLPGSTSTESSHSSGAERMAAGIADFFGRLGGFARAVVGIG